MKSIKDLESISQPINQSVSNLVKIGYEINKRSRINEITHTIAPFMPIDPAIFSCDQHKASIPGQHLVHGLQPF